MADWQGYEALCNRLGIVANPYDKVEESNHRLMSILLDRIEALEQHNSTGGTEDGHSSE